MSHNVLELVLAVDDSLLQELQCLADEFKLVDNLLQSRFDFRSQPPEGDPFQKLSRWRHVRIRSGLLGVFVLFFSEALIEALGGRLGLPLVLEVPHLRSSGRRELVHLLLLGDEHFSDYFRLDLGQIFCSDWVHV